MLPENMFNEEIFKIVLSKPVKGVDLKRIEILKSENMYQASKYTQKQVFHSNHDAKSIREVLNEYMNASFLQYTAWDKEFEYSARVTKKGKVLASRRKSKAEVKRENLANGGFNRQKNHIIREGENIPVLVDMGVFTKELRVAAPMWDKYKQINRFIEILADETGGLTQNTTVNVIDFGCGKSYLTFLVYHYFTQVKGLRVNICGLDLNAEIVEKCATAAKKYGYDSLTFRQGDIGSQSAPPLENWGVQGSFNIVISLHACDTATDHALFNAIKWQADLICAVPCCQHELRNQMKPQSLKIFADYGIIKERIASLATDAIRAKLLEMHGYRAQIIEFTAMEHTAKNLLIRARKTSARKTGADAELQAVLQEFSFKPALLGLLEGLKKM
ncbi:MAG: SAM-dependent methyltransferase [Defluviitaleaceae bacterium]|nr:SAM-dependent methyltransferase [Defluviitaleaceae bacterium]MCL2264084.1 SAM-dependent methyltransferase [Defluviitaleaceae bacterium]